MEDVASDVCRGLPPLRLVVRGLRRRCLRGEDVVIRRARLHECRGADAADPVEPHAPRRAGAYTRPLFGST